MSNLPGYSVDDDPHTESPTAEPELEDEDEDEPVLVATSARDTLLGTTIPSSPTPPLVSTQPTPTPPSRQHTEERDTAAASTTATTTTSTTTTPSLTERPGVDEFADPKIAPLHAIFPDYDAALLYTVIDSVGGDQDRAVDALLAMSDPEHIPTHSAPTHEPSVAEQTQLDEEFARRLLLEDEQQYARDQIAQRQQQEQQEQMRQFPYAQRSHAPVPQRGDGATAQQQQPQPQRDTMTDVQEQFSKLAETGKRTFSSFVSKVKAKVQDFDQTRNTSNPSTAGASTSTGTSYAAQPPSPVLDRHAQQAYYAPRAVPSSRSGTIYNDFENPPRHPSSSDRDSSGVPPPPATNSGRPSNIDPGKIGLLPKRPVSLVNAESPSGNVHDEEEEELEYVENPFEEGGKYS